VILRTATTIFFQFKEALPARLRQLWHVRVESVYVVISEASTLLLLVEGIALNVIQLPDHMAMTIATLSSGPISHRCDKS
jgi:hypothetical protein